MAILKPELIVAAIVVLIGVVGLVLIKKRLIKLVGKEGYKYMSISSSNNATPISTPNALAEAEVYIAYGRKEQAIQVLEKALHEDPSRADILARLNEIKQSL
jgi:hypothetical protein